MPALRPRSRREFLAVGSAALGAMALVAAVETVLPGWARRRLLGLRRRDAGDITPDEFRSQVGSHVRLTAENGTSVSARIADVRDCSALTRAEGIQQFSVLLESDIREALPQGVCAVEHPELGVCNLLVVPTVTTRPCADYAISFTRLA